MSRDFLKMSDGELWEQVRSRFPEEESSAAIAEVVGVSYRTVARWREMGDSARMDRRTRTQVLAFLGAAAPREGDVDAYVRGILRVREMIDLELRALGVRPSGDAEDVGAGAVKAVEENPETGGDGKRGGGGM